jgi:hypothetical protein
MRRNLNRSGLREITEAIKYARGQGLAPDGRWQGGHGVLTGPVMIDGRRHPHDLLAEAHGQHGRGALALFKFADPDTMEELVRGYTLARDAGLLLDLVKVKA